MNVLIVALVSVLLYAAINDAIKTQLPNLVNKSSKYLRTFIDNWDSILIFGN